MKRRQIIIEIISFLFILLFVYAALNKLVDYQKFKIQIGQSPLLTGFGDTIPWMVIVVELVVSIMLITPRLRLSAFFSSFCLMTMFTAYVVAILKFSPYVPCSCGGVLEKLGWTEHLIFNGAFLILSGVAVVKQLDQNAALIESKA
ncbi:MAG TPA: DoxX family membrane protein [Cyclobacteriaceae bacterium]|nr:DoxX family membrane protein [Cyclobacteriaceae bacterium]HRF32980.1 DoxX family membrane protein [Cyclobacteriaceae bacterium]